MATLTLGNVGQPEAVHAGVNARICRISLSVTWSSGDIHIIGRIPHGAIPLDAIFYPGAAVAGTTVAKYGTSASNDLFFASATYSNAVYRNTVKLGSSVQVSISDDSMPRYENLTAVFTAAASIGHVGDLVIFYKMPGQSF